MIIFVKLGNLASIQDGIFKHIQSYATQHPLFHSSKQQQPVFCHSMFTGVVQHHPTVGRKI